MIYAGTCRHLTAAEIAEKSSLRPPALRLAVRTSDGALRTATWAGMRKIWRRTAVIFCCGGLTGCLPISWLWWWTTPPMGVTEVVRGADLLDSTPRQLYLYHLLGLTPPRFYHFPLLLTAEGKRLSKRDSAVGLDSLQG